MLRSLLLQWSFVSLILAYYCQCEAMATGAPNNNAANVIISGGGPGGLLTSILLNNLGIRSTVLEETREPDEWSSKSYAMNLNERGQAALERGGCLGAVAREGNEKVCSYFVDGTTGAITVVPRRETAASIGVSRPILVRCIEDAARDLPLVTVRRGVKVARVVAEEDGGSSGSGMLHVHLEDGTVLPATHLVGADGKWSKVRRSFPSLSAQAKLVSCKGFGVLLFSENLIPGWNKDGTYIIAPPADESGSKQDFYIIGSPTINGGMSLAMVCSDSVSERYPWLRPEAAAGMRPGDWKEEVGMESKAPDTDLSDSLEGMLRETVPGFHALLDREVYKTAQLGRRASWLQMSAAEEGKGVSYSTEDGRVALIGDAAHAMTPSMGEGGNCAMESAVKLAHAVEATMKERGDTVCTVGTLNKAFLSYGVSRPCEVQPVQEMSAARNNK